MVGHGWGDLWPVVRWGRQRKIRVGPLTVAGYGHTEAGNPRSCALAYEIRYMLSGALPARGTVCQQSMVPFPASPGD
jgi:hypothetical protein